MYTKRRAEGVVRQTEWNNNNMCIYLGSNPKPSLKQSKAVPLRLDDVFFFYFLLYTIQSQTILFKIRSYMINF